MHLPTLLTITSNLYGSLDVFDTSAFDIDTMFPFQLYNFNMSC